MRDYEITILVKPDLDEKKLETWNKSFQGLLDKSEAKVKGKVNTSKRALSYEVLKFNEANYIFAEVGMEANKVAAMEAILKNDDSVIRYLIIKKD